MAEDTLASTLLVKELFFIVAGSLDNKIKLSLSVIHLRLRYITATNVLVFHRTVFFFSFFYVLRL